MSAAPIDREKLAKLLAMFSSDHDGEVVNAARQAERLRRGAGVTWGDILTPSLPSPTRHREVENVENVENVEDAISFALDFEAALTRWEVSFLVSLRRQRTPVSAKQHRILSQILDKLRATAARAA